MITSITGQLVAATPLTATIEVGGFGYEVHIPVTTAERLPSLGQQAKLHTVAVYREDSQTLYGFSTEEERNFFRLLVEKVTGVGPKMALSVLSKLSLATLKGAIAAGDIGLLSKCPGIGKKTAERLVIELRDYLNPAELAGAAATACNGLAVVAATGANGVAGRETSCWGSDRRGGELPLAGRGEDPVGPSQSCPPRTAPLMVQGP
jgi:Holliday junction DNA helicase RuvA